MYLLIIGVVLSALGLVGVTVSRGDRRMRIAALLVGAAGVVLLVATRPSTLPGRKQAEAVRHLCRSTALKLEAFELQRLTSHPPWTQDRAVWTWSGIAKLLGHTAELCIRDVDSCSNLLVTSPLRSRFTVELHELVVAFRTGEPCTR